MTLVRQSNVWSDEEILEVLALRDVDGLSAKEIALMFGTTKNSIIGLWNRIAKAQESGDYGDGTMPARWWK